MLIRQMRDQGMDTIVGGADAWPTDEFWPIAAPGARGTFMTFSPDPRKTLVWRRISKRFRAAGIEPECFTLFAYNPSSKRSKASYSMLRLCVSNAIILFLLGVAIVLVGFSRN